MNKKYKVVSLVLLGVLAVLGIAVLLRDANIAILNPKGLIAERQRDLIVFATLLMLVVVVPVFVLTFFIAWKYRATNTRARYTPNWDHSRRLEFIWWGVPILIIGVLSVVIWTSSHDLDPYKPLVSRRQPVKVQVISLQWKWLFIYPKEGIATVNYLKFPEDTPVDFELTADSPMNSFWIPQLGGQIYAMSGMRTQLHLMASEQGTYAGSSANLSGEGFASMRFKAAAVSDNEYQKWLQSVRMSQGRLDMAEYGKLTKPSKGDKPYDYAMSEPGLYDKIIMKYTMPGNTPAITGG